MTTVTLHADEHILERARLCAEERHTTVDSLFQVALELMADQGTSSDWEMARAKLRSGSTHEPEGNWTREERNLRPSKWLTGVEQREQSEDGGNLFLKAAREAGTFYIERPVTRAEMNER